ncbi:16S rRNA (guanine(966)-N(2))-methyltransferase RsmD [Mesoplasma florum]|uniref:16S rRNA (guanine(966)-N(2))-methyltransferase RsmD n=1 Tax=Mesoplasma florum TaxID=2151 RepID=UPI000D03E965|nr:16S rRNA (guanine(966)-N(2))-methyltransferase RsmD [Mesoplasma florum]AVN58804.1 16S rRNA (guanine(966)-N(2))-methyltransferase RsmD [Mesoplasma florum]AVN64937.1 16S rRNA (guanine(966)-N(2))-methyltransferase RsmD [Mesoplasma florum]
MNVISGKYKGLKLNTLEGMNTRPTLTRIKEDAFNIIDNYFIFEGKKSLDIFGGSGALTIEGLSRGISFGIINDYSRDAIKVIKSNLAKTKSTNWEIHNKDYLELLDFLCFKHEKFDLVYMDPPFAKIESYAQVFTKLLELNLLNNWAVIMIESEMPLNEEVISQFKLLKYKDYNKKHLYIIRLENKDEE